ncbi:unnamed protein product [Dibothriocephalus latus]|uniref:Reverse transcriptase domain-containing protein n=1 Tax=Dibothriocephalus latus TaxID=60516 RepID=A0A3P6PS23_DIBLA|nr:unnamed protein product [Dibothriocephalus latus]
MFAPTRVLTTTVNDLLIADDCSLNTTTEADMQSSKDLFTTGCRNFGLKINTEKTVTVHQPPPGADYGAPHINVNGAHVKNVDNLTFLGSTLSRNIEVARRIFKASQAFGRLQVCVRNRHGL